MDIILRPGEDGYERYALILDTEYRIRGVTYDCWAVPDAPRVDELPPGRVADYLYIDERYVYDPLGPKAQQDTPAGTIFMADGEMYRATTAIGIGERITDYNSEKVSAVDLLNALAEQKGE